MFDNKGQILDVSANEDCQIIDKIINILNDNYKILLELYLYFIAIYFLNNFTLYNAKV